MARHAALLFLLAAPLAAADWPQFRGPNRDGVSVETGLLKSWPEDGPPLAWQTKGLGGGYSTVSIAGDKIFTLGNKGKVSNVVALNKANGEVLWSSEVGAAGGNLGCTPTVEGSRVYALGQQGDLVCLDTADGKRIWHRNVQKEFGGKFGGWQYCESPLVDGDRLIVTPGGDTATIVALDKATGKNIWTCPVKGISTDAGYSSVVVSKVGTVKHYVQLLNGGLVGISLDGKVLWTYGKLGPNTANIPTPIIQGDTVFASAGYGKGGALLKLTATGKGITAKEVYFNPALTNKHGGVVRVGNYVYGDTDDQGKPFCADIKTGKVQWKRNGGGEGRGSTAVAAADGHLYFHYENGVVALVDASPGGGYKEVGAFKVPKTNGPSWAHPVVSDGKLYLREGDMLYAYDVKAK